MHIPWASLYNSSYNVIIIKGRVSQMTPHKYYLSPQKKYIYPGVLRRSPRLLLLMPTYPVSQAFSLLNTLFADWPFVASHIWILLLMRTRTWTQRVNPTPFEMSKYIDTETRVLGKSWASDSTNKTDLGTCPSSQPQRKVMLKAGRERYSMWPH